MTDSHGTPKTNEQMIIMGRIIITHAWIFAESVGKWDNEPSDEKTRPNFKTHLTAAQINHKKAPPVDTTSQHGYTNQANTAEKFLLKIETRKQHESYFAAELDIHKEIEALKQQLAIPTQREDNTPSSKTEMQLLMENVNSLKAQMNNKMEHRSPNGNRKPKGERHKRQYCQTYRCCAHKSKDRKKKVLPTKMKIPLKTLWEEALTNDSGSTHITPDQLG